MFILKNAPFFSQLILGWAIAGSNDNVFRSTQGNARLAPDFLADAMGCQISMGTVGFEVPNFETPDVITMGMSSAGKNCQWVVRRWFGDVWWTRHDSATSILSIFQPKFYFTPTLLTHISGDLILPSHATPKIFRFLPAGHLRKHQCLRAGPWFAPRLDVWMGIRLWYEHV